MGTTYADPDLKDKVASIVPSANADSHEFDKWDPAIPLVRMAVNEEFEATYKLKDFDGDNIRGIEITKSPDKMTYVDKDPFEADGIEITLTDKNGNTKVIGKDELGDFGITLDPEGKTVLKKGNFDAEDPESGDNGRKITATLGDLTAESGEGIQVISGIIPYEPYNPQRPVDVNDPNIPTEDENGNPIDRDKYVQIAFKVNPEEGGSLSMGDLQDKKIIAALVKADTGIYKVEKPETTPADDYGFVDWTKPQGNSNTVQQGDIFTANFMKSGTEIESPKVVIPEDWKVVSVITDPNTIKDSEPDKVYAVKPNGKLAKEKFPAISPAKGYKDAKWYQGEAEVENNLPWEVAITENTTFTAKASEQNFAEKIIEAGGLKPVDIKVWKNGEITWESGLALNLKEDYEADRAELQGLLNEATVEEITDPARTSKKAGDFEGTLKVTFEDNTEEKPSVIEVENQWLYVRDEKVTDKDDKNVPDDAIEVEFVAGDGVDFIKATSLRVKPGTELLDADFPSVSLEEKFKKPVSWSPEDRVVTTDNNTFTASAVSAIFDGENITGIEITKDPTKMTYTEGENPNHDGIQVTLTDKNGNTKVVGKDELEDYEITITPAEDAGLTKNDNGEHFVASVKDKDDQEITANSTETITINDKISDTEIIPYIPSDLDDPTNKDDENIPGSDDGGKIDKDQYNIVAFKSEDKTKGLLSVEGNQDLQKQEVISVMVKKGLTWENVKAPSPVPAENHKFWKWQPSLPEGRMIVQQGEEFEAKFLTDGQEIDPNVDDLPEGTFKVTVNKSVGIADNELYGKAYAVFSGSKLDEDKFPTPTAEKNYKNARWDNLDENTNPWDIGITENTNFTAIADSDKIIHPEPGVEKPEGYVRLTFDAKDGCFTKAEDENSEDIRVKHLDVLNTTAYTDSDLIEAIAAIKPTPNDDTKKFNGWNPLVPNTGIVSDQTFDAQYISKDKIVDVPEEDIDDPNKPVPAGYERLTFKAGEGKIGGKEKFAFDVLKGTKYNDQDLVSKINLIETSIVPKYATKKFDKWNPELPATETAVETSSYTALYTDKTKIVDVPEDEIDQDAPEGYVRLTFDATADGKIDGKQKVAFDVLSGSKYNDEVVVNKIKSIVVVPNSDTKVFDKWDSEVPADETVIETKTYTAVYKDKDKVVDVDDPETEVPEGYARLKFKATEDGYFAKTEDVTVRVKAIDVLQGTNYSDEALQAKIKDIVPRAEASTDEFDKWNPEIPESRLVVDEAFTATYKAKAFNKDGITQIEIVKVPDKMNYTDGDKFEADGIQIKLTDENGNTVTIGKEELEEYKVTLDPKDGTKLTKTDDGKAITAKVQGVNDQGEAEDKSATSTETIKVNNKISDADVIPFVPGDPEKPTDPNGAPETDDDGNTIDKAQYNIVAFKTEDEAKGTLTLGEKSGPVISVMVKKSSTWKSLTEPTPVAKENNKFWKWEPSLPNEKMLVEDGEIFTALFVANGQEIYPGVDDLPEGANKVSIVKGLGVKGKTDADEEKFGKAYVIFDDEKLDQGKFPLIEAEINYKDPKWNVENPWEQPITQETIFTASADSEKLIDVDNPDSDVPKGYVRLKFDATDKGNFGKVQDSQENITIRAIDVLEGTSYTDADLKAKISEITPVPNTDTEKFTGWSPEVPTNNVLVAEETYTAQYADKDKIKDVDDTTADPEAGYVRLTFNSGEGYFTEETVKVKAIDVLKGTKYNDQDLVSKINLIETSIVPNDETKKFDKWNPELPATETDVKTSSYTAQYVLKDNIVDVPEDEIDEDIPAGYVRLTFDATAEGKIDGKQRVAFDVLSGSKYNDEVVVNKIKSIVAVPNSATKVFDKWNSEVPTDETVIEAKTYTAVYKDKDKVVDVDDPETEVPEGYARLKFKATENGYFTKTEDVTVRVKALDVLQGTSYSDQDLKDAIANIVPTANDSKQEFDNWDPSVPTTGKVDTQEFTATYKTKAFDKDNITGIEITKDPTKMTYTEGENPSHDGIQVTLTDKNGNTKVVDKDELGDYGITITPAEDTELTKDDNGEHFVAKISCKDENGGGKELEANSTETIKVTDKISDENIIPFEPSDPQNPADPDDPKIPNEDSEKNPIVRDEYVVVGFKTDGNGKLKADENSEAKDALSFLVKKGTYFGKISLPKPVENDGYKFDSWSPGLPDKLDEVNQDMAYTATFLEIESSNKAEIEQAPNEEDKVVITGKVEAPVDGNTEVFIGDGDGNKLEIPGAEIDLNPNTGEITVKLPKKDPEAGIDNGVEDEDKITVVIQEPGKKPSPSDPLEIDLKAPEVTGTSKEGGHGMFVDIEAEVNKTFDPTNDPKVIVNGKEYPIEGDEISTNEDGSYKITIKDRIPRDNIDDKDQDIKIDLADELGNRTVENLDYKVVEDPLYYELEQPSPGVAFIVFEDSNADEFDISIARGIDVKEVITVESDKDLQMVMLEEGLEVGDIITITARRGLEEKTGEHVVY